MAEPKAGKDVAKGEVDEQLYLEETFYILSKKNSVFKVRLSSKGLCLIKENEGSRKEQTILFRDIVGSKCMRSKRRLAGAGSCVCSSFVRQQQLKVVEENSGELDENDTSAYLYIYAYVLKPCRRTFKRERTTITLRFRSFDKYEDNYKEAQRWRTALKCLVAHQPIGPVAPSSDKKLLILLNPKSGPGKAREQFQMKVAPILQEAEVPYDLHITKYANYAREFVRTRNVYSWRGIVVIGGDGVLFEVLNGMFERMDWQEALSELPLGIIPCGSGNGLARTICHLYEEPFTAGNLTGLSMALTRGKTTAMDVVRIETKSKIMFSFLSVGWGLLSDIDVESERLRIVGGQRFALWAVLRLVGLRKYKGVVSYVKIKNASNLPKPRPLTTLSHSVSHEGALDSPDAEAFIDCDSSEIFTTAKEGKTYQRADSWYSVNSRRSAFFSARGDSEYLSITSGDDARTPTHKCMHGPASHLPSLLTQLPPQWQHEEGEFVTVHISYVSHINEDFLFAPQSDLSDGVMWMLIIKAGVTRSQLFSFLLGVGQGLHAEMNNEHMKFIPVSAFRIVPEGTAGNLTVDGEIVEYGPIQGEIFPNIINLIVPDTE